MKLNIVVWIVPVLMLFVALTDQAYTYYSLPRVVVCVVCAFLAFAEYGLRKTSLWMIGPVNFPVLYNPIAPARLSGEVWAPSNVVTALFLIAHALAYRGGLVRKGKAELLRLREPGRRAKSASFVRR